MSNGWTAEKAKAKYERLKAEGRCTRCTGKLLDDWKGVMCPECAELRLTNESAASRRKRLARHRKWQKQYDAEHAADIAKKRKARYLDKKVRGECVTCPATALEDSLYCVDCRETHRKRIREAARRRRAGVTPIKTSRRRKGEKKQVRVIAAPTQAESLTPIADYRRGDMSLTRAAIRYAELCNGVDAQTIGDEFGADLKQRNGIGIALMRGVRQGRLMVDGAGPGREFYPARRARRAA